MHHILSRYLLPWFSNKLAVPTVKTSTHGCSFFVSWPSVYNNLLDNLRTPSLSVDTIWKHSCSHNTTFRCYSTSETSVLMRYTESLLRTEVTEVSSQYQFESFLLHVRRNCKHFVSWIELKAGASWRQVRDRFQWSWVFTLQTWRHVIDVDNTIIRPEKTKTDTWIKKKLTTWSSECQMTKAFMMKANNYANTTSFFCLLANFMQSTE